MQFKTFAAATVAQALEAVKQEMGPEAVIVSTRHRQQGLFRPRTVEVTVAIDEQHPPTLFNQRPGATSQAPQAAPVTAPAARAMGDAAAHLAQAALASAEPGPGLLAADEQRLERALEPMRRELRALRQAIKAGDQGDDGEALQAMSRELAAVREGLAQLDARERPPAASERPLARILEAADVDAQLARRLTDEVVRGRRGPADRGADLEDLTARAASCLKLPRPSILQGGAQRLALVGPTGAGKTLLTAKLADLARSHGLRVAIIGTDAFRIAAFEELAQYAALVDVPLLVARDAKSFARAIDAQAEADVILVDTAGRGAAAGAELGELGRLFAAHDVQPVLTLPAALRHAELAQLAGAFAPMDLAGLAFTKIDEACALGALLSAGHLTGRPIHYLTGSQQVQDGLVFTNPQELAERMVGMVLESNRMAWGPDQATLGEEEAYAR